MVANETNSVEAFFKLKVSVCRSYALPLHDPRRNGFKCRSLCRPLIKQNDHLLGQTEVVKNVKTSLLKILNNGTV